MIGQVVRFLPLGGEANVRIAVEVQVPDIRLPMVVQEQPGAVAALPAGDGACINGLQQRLIPVDGNFLHRAEAANLLTGLHFQLQLRAVP